MCKIVKASLILILLFLLYPVNLNAQQWTAEQKDVWKAVETYNDIAAKGDVEGFLSYFDDSYIGWDNESEVPHTKADIQKFVNYWMKKGKVVVFTITPARIWVNGNFAYVHYYYTQVYEDKDGKPFTERGRWTDILMKKDGKWVMIGDHGGKTSK
jgi:ketosteroid isomerase-like protein